MPVVDAAGIRKNGKSPLFRSAVGRTGTLASIVMDSVDAWRRVQRPAGDLDMKDRIGCHTFHVIGMM